MTPTRKRKNHEDSSKYNKKKYDSRRNGVMKKVHALHEICGAKVTVIIQVPREISSIDTNTYIYQSQPG